MLYKILLKESLKGKTNALSERFDSVVITLQRDSNSKNKCFSKRFDSVVYESLLK